MQYASNAVGTGSAEACVTPIAPASASLCEPSGLTMVAVTPITSVSVTVAAWLVAGNNTAAVRSEDRIALRIRLQTRDLNLISEPPAGERPLRPDDCQGRSNRSQPAQTAIRGLRANRAVTCAHLGGGSPAAPRTVIRDNRKAPL